MRKFHSVLLLLVIIPFMSKAQGADNPVYKYGVGNFFVGLNAGAQLSFNAYKSGWSQLGRDFAYGDVTIQGKPLNWNMGLDVSYMATERLRPRFEMKYVRMVYKMNWDSMEGWEDFDLNNLPEGVSTGDYVWTLARLRNMNLNVFADYLLFGENSKFKLFASPGIKWELHMGSTHKSKTLAGRTVRKNLDPHQKWEHFHPHSAAALALGGIGKYDVNEFFGFTFKPEYTFFLRKFAHVNDKPFHRLSFNVGLEIRIK